MVAGRISKGFNFIRGAFLPVFISGLIVPLILPSVVLAAEGGGFSISDIAASISNEGLSSALRILLLLTVLTLIPAILLMMTSFTRFVIVLSLLRHALGLQQSPPNQIIIGIALFMTLFVMTPVFNNAYTNSLKPYLDDEISEQEAMTRGLNPFRKFMFRQTGEDELALFVDMSEMKRPDNPDDVPISILVPAFITSELKRAFQIGFVIFIPFLVIDMVIASVLMSMGMMMLPPILISLPFKLMLFVLADGWNLLIGSLVKGVLS